MIRNVSAFIVLFSVSALVNASIIDNCVEDWPKRLQEIDAQIQEMNDAARTIFKDPYLASDTFATLPTNDIHLFFDLMAKDRSCQRRIGVTEDKVKEKVELLSRMDGYSKCSYIVSEVAALTQEVNKIKKFYDNAKSGSEKEVLAEILDERIFSVRRVASRHSGAFVCSPYKDFEKFLKSVPNEMRELKYSL